MIYLRWMVPTALQSSRGRNYKSLQWIEISHSVQFQDMKWLSMLLAHVFVINFYYMYIYRNKKHKKRELFEWICSAVHTPVSDHITLECCDASVCCWLELFGFVQYKTRLTWALFIKLQQLQLCKYLQQDIIAWSFQWILQFFSKLHILYITAVVMWRIRISCLTFDQKVDSLKPNQTRATFLFIYFCYSKKV